MANIEFTPTSGVAYGSEFTDGNKAYITSPIAIATNAPLDARMQVPNKAALTAENTWRLNSTASKNQGMNTAYYGMLTYVATDTDASNNGLYVLTSITGNVVNDKTNTNAWVKISQTNDDIETLIDNNINNKTYITLPGINNGNPVTIQAALSAILSLTPTEEGLKEINNRLTNLEETLGTNLTYEIVDSTEKPADPKKNIIYFIKTATTDTDSIYEEWMYFETSEGVGSWEKIGSTKVDLTNYYTFEETDNAIKAATTVDALVTDVAAWRAKLGVKSSDETTSEISTAVANATTLDSLVTDASSWRSKLGVKSSDDVTSEINSSVEGLAKLDASNLSDENVSSWREKLGVPTLPDVYSKEEVDTKVKAIQEATDEDIDFSAWRTKLGLPSLKNIKDNSTTGVVLASKKYVDIYTDPTSISVDADACLIRSINSGNITETAIAKINDSFEVIHEILSGSEFVSISLAEDATDLSSITYSASTGTLVEVIYYKEITE